MPAIFVKHMDGDLIEQVAVLPIDKGLRSFVRDGFRGKDEKRFPVSRQEPECESFGRGEIAKQEMSRRPSRSFGTGFLRARKNQTFGFPASMVFERCRI